MYMYRPQQGVVLSKVNNDVTIDVIQNSLFWHSPSFLSIIVNQ